MSFDLKFDDTIETGEGRKYMALHGPDFNSFESEGSGIYLLDPISIKAIRTGVKCMDVIKSLKRELTEDYFQELPKKFAALVQLLEDRKLVFAQIDYLIRNTPIKETLNFNLELMVQNIKYISMFHSRKQSSRNEILMSQNASLLNLGYVAQLLCVNQEVVVLSMRGTAFLCHLFVSLCHEVGLTNVKLVLVEDLAISEMKIISYSYIISVSGSMGIVTDRADVDSAVDVFLSSVTKNPWKIRRIMVQESICDRLIDALSWKAELDPTDSNLDDIASKCSNIFEIKGKKFVYEYCGEEQTDPMTDQDDDIVIIEAYRTVKELIFLVNAYKPLSVSLWCSDVSQSNEIAYGIESTIIWINDYGCFRGPLKSSQALYSIIDISYYTRIVSVATNSAPLGNVRNKWVKLSESEKSTIFTSTLKQFKNYEQTNVSNLYSCVDGSFAEVIDGCICVGTDVANSAVYVDDETPLLEVLRCLLKGNAVIYRSNDPMAEFYEALRLKGVPLEACAKSEGRALVASHYSAHRLKVVRTSFGTIFAN